MTYHLEYSTGRVFDFVNSMCPMPAVAGMRGIGLDCGGQLQMGAIYERVNAHNAWIHYSKNPGWHSGARQFLYAAFAYPFLQCGVSRLSGYVDADNAAARRFNEHLGFQPEAVLRGAAMKGGDVIIYAMQRSRCRYV